MSERRWEETEARVRAVIATTGESLGRIDALLAELADRPALPPPVDLIVFDEVRDLPAEEWDRAKGILEERRR